MADISKVKLPGSDTIYDIKDATARSGLANIAYGSCSTAAATAAKTVAAEGFTLTTGARIAVKFTVTNTAANPTLDVNSTGAKAIYYRGSAISKIYLVANRTYEFVYDGTHYDLIGDLDTNANVTTSPTTSGTIYITGKTSNAANNNATEVLNSNVTIDASVGKIKTNATASTDDNSVVTTKGYVDSLIGESVAGITGAMHFKGTVTSVPASSSLYLNGSETATTMQEGDVVIYDSKEYVFDGTNWHELGDESHHIPVVTGVSGQVPKFTSTGTLESTGYELNKTVPSNAVFTDVSVTSSDNHYTPSTASGGDKTASASGATAAWSIDVVKGVTLNTDGKGHVTGLSVTSGKIPANPNTNTTYTLSGAASGNTWVSTLTPSSGSATTSTVPAMGAATSSAAGSAGLVPAPGSGKDTSFLRGDGTWVVPDDTKVTSSANHYTPSTASGQDKTASATGATAAWSIDVVKGVTLNTDGKGHVTGLSVTSGKIPANPNTDTKVTNTLNTTAKAYVTGTTSATTNTGTQIFDTGVYFEGGGNLHADGTINGAVPYGLCETAADTAAKTVSVNGTYTLTEGARVIVKFNNANSAANPTLNVNSTGAKAIYYKNSAITAAFLNSKGTYEFIYNGTQYEIVGTINTHPTVYVGPSNAPINSSTADPYIVLGQVNGYGYTGFRLIGDGTTSITSDENHNITISSTGVTNTTDTKVTNTLATTTKAYITGTSTASTNTGTQVFDTGVYLESTAGNFHADGTINGLVPYGTCSTAAATAAKTVSVNGTFKLAAGARVIVKFSNTNSAASPTLNVNSTGAKAIYINGAATPTLGYLNAGETYTFIYNGSQYEMLGNTAINGCVIDVPSCSRVWDSKANVRQLVSLQYSDRSGGTAILPILSGTVLGDGVTTNTNNGSAVAFSNGGLTIVAGGEGCASNMLNRASSSITGDTGKFCLAGSTSNANVGNEELVLASDGKISLYPGYNSIAATDNITAKAYFDDNGSFNGPSTIASVITDINPGTHLNVVNSNKVPIVMTNPGSNFNMLACINSTNGKFYFGAYGADFKLHYRANSETANSATKIATLLNESGGASFPGNFNVGGNRLILGSGNSVTHDTAFALGGSNTVSHYGGALGRSNTLSGENSYALGGWNTVSSEQSVAICDNNTISDYENISSGTTVLKHAVAIGSYNTLQPNSTYRTKATVSEISDFYALGTSNTVNHPGIVAGHGSSISINETPYAARSDFSAVLGSYATASDFNACSIGYATKAESNGCFVCGRQNTSTGGANHSFTSSSSTSRVFIVGNGYSQADSSSSTGYKHIRSSAFSVSYSGNLYATGTSISSGADYAEFVKEWWDRNADNEDRVGYMVTVKNGKLYKANEGDYIIGITSGAPSVLGNGDCEYFWRYERDEFNRIIEEEIDDLRVKVDDNGEIIRDEEGKALYDKVGTIKVKKENPNYDPSLQESYIQRSERPEWDYVGMRGIVPCRDDGTCIEGGFCKCGTDGIATKADARGFDTYYVLERINDHVISVEVK